MLSHNRVNPLAAVKRFVGRRDGMSCDSQNGIECGHWVKAAVEKVFLARGVIRKHTLELRETSWEATVIHTLDLAQVNLFGKQPDRHSINRS